MEKNKEKIFLFLIIPVILILISNLPESLKEEYFVLNSKVPSISSLFLSKYVHFNIEHLTGNVLFYLIAAYMILKFETNKKCFYKTMVFLFLILPFIISFIVIGFVPDTNSMGFSGIVAGFIGYFAYVVYTYVKNSWKVNVDLNFLVLIFITNMLIGVALWPDQLFLLFIIPVFVILVYPNQKLLIEVISVLKNQKMSFWNCFYFILAIMILFILPALLIQINGPTNILSHYVGYVAGIFFPIFLSTLKQI